MRLHPEVTQDEAYDWLKQQVAQDSSSTDTEKELEPVLRQTAEAMAVISRFVLPDELEPMFP
jgi:hypothetical protein